MAKNRWVQVTGVVTAAALLLGCAADESEEPASDDAESQQQESETQNTDEAATESAGPESAGPESAGPESAEAEADESGAEEAEGGTETPETETPESGAADADEPAAEEETSDDAGWVEAESGSGEYVAEFPAEPTRQTQTVPELDAEQDLTLAEVDGAAYLLTEVPLNGTPFDLDASVQGNIEGVLANLEQQTGEQGEVIPVSEETGEFEGEETREAAVDIEVGDLSAHYRVLIFVREDTLVQVIYNGEQGAGQDGADRFFDSFGLS